MSEKQYAEGHWLGVGIGVGIAIGVPVGLLMGIVMDNIPIGFALGPGMGVAIGVAIGTALEARHKDQIRPLTEAEKRTRRWAVLLGLALLLIGVLVFALILFAR